MNALGQRMFRNRELLVVSVLQIVLLWPMLRTPYLFDDTINSEWNAGARYVDQGFFDFAGTLSWDWVVLEGRWMPLGTFQAGVQWALIDSVVAYKALLMLFVVLSTLAVGALLRRLGASAPVAALVAVAASLTFQFRLFHDPILAYTGLQQFVLAEIAISALFFDVWLRERRRWALVASLLLIVIACSTYESALLLSAVHLVVAIAYERRFLAGLRAALPALLTGGAFIVLALVLRMQASSDSTFYEPSLSPVSAGKTLGIQLLGTLPLSYVGLNPSDTFLYRGQALIRDMGVGSLVTGVLMGVCAGWLVYRATRKRQSAPPWNAGLAAALGAVLLLVAAAPIAIASRYQSELVPGISYLPVYVQGFGLALLAVAGLMLLQRRVRGRSGVLTLSLVVAVGAAGVGALTSRANTVVVDLTQSARELRQTAEDALAAGLLAESEPNVRMYTSVPTPAFLTPSFLLAHADRRFLSSRPLKPLTWRPPDGPSPWYTDSAPDYMVAGPLRNGAGRSRVYLAPREDARSWLVLSAGARPDARIASATRGANVVLLPQATDPTKVTLEPVRSAAPFVRSFAGCDEADPAQRRWCGRSGAIAVVNPTGRPLHLQLSFGLRTAGPRRATVTIRTVERTRRVRVADVPLVTTLVLDVPARGAQTIELSTDGPRVPSPGDPRVIHFGVLGTTLSPV